MNKYVWPVLVACVVLGVTGMLVFRHVKFRSPEVEQVMQLQESMVKKSNEKYPGMSKQQAIQAVVTDTIRDVIANQKDEHKKYEFLVGGFFGFYQVNTRARYDYCKERGVDISSFVQEFEKRNQKEYEQALKFAQQLGFDVEKTYNVLAEAHRNTIEHDMQDIAAATKGTEKSACQLMALQAPRFADFLYIGTRQPDLYKVLFVDKH